MSHKLNTYLRRTVREGLPPKHILSEQGAAACKKALRDALSARTPCDPKQLLGRLLVAAQTADVNPDVIRKIGENLAILMTHQLDNLYNNTNKKTEEVEISPNPRPK